MNRRRFLMKSGILALSASPLIVQQSIAKTCPPITDQQPISILTMCPIKKATCKDFELVTDELKSELNQLRSNRSRWGSIRQQEFMALSGRLTESLNEAEKAYESSDKANSKEKIYMWVELALMVIGIKYKTPIVVGSITFYTLLKGPAELVAGSYRGGLEKEVLFAYLGDRMYTIVQLITSNVVSTVLNIFSVLKEISDIWDSDRELSEKSYKINQLTNNMRFVNQQLNRLTEPQDWANFYERLYVSNLEGLSKYIEMSRAYDCRDLPFDHRPRFSKSLP